MSTAPEHHEGLVVVDLGANMRDMTQPPRLSNAQVESLAIEFVIAQEAEEGRTARDTRHQGAVADIESGDRIIEVKAAGTSSRGYDVWLEPRQYVAATTDPEHFWLYLVENVRQGDPAQFRLLRFGGARLRELLVRAKRQEYYTVPVPTRVYDEVLEEG